MSAVSEISQRDLRLRSKEIMDAVEDGISFTVTRAGRQIGELIPLRGRQRFVTRIDFVIGSRAAPAIDLEQFRAEQHEAYDEDVDPFGR
ncbi:type II toxin-antitoxin system Phd/YefM family antitoxin [Nocardioides stalactiti]|uniref:type II toxin-antitoxin system Phd/YefM family antitoxin n=1 Tax=Nocardioides stalactiti TaxID=2755356 RepID=UPI001601C7CB|nr:prevent-host-death protein [Nocardioides stalactiti]